MKNIVKSPSAMTAIFIALLVLGAFAAFTIPWTMQVTGDAPPMSQSAQELGDQIDAAALDRDTAQYEYDKVQAGITDKRSEIAKLEQDIRDLEVSASDYKDTIQQANDTTNALQYVLCTRDKLIWAIGSPKGAPMRATLPCDQWQPPVVSSSSASSF